jgi:hypothetical protein
MEIINSNKSGNYTILQIIINDITYTEFFEYIASYKIQLAYVGCMIELKDSYTYNNFFMYLDNFNKVIKIYSSRNGGKRNMYN